MVVTLEIYQLGEAVFCMFSGIQGTFPDALYRLAEFL